MTSVSDELVEILVCPETKQPVSLATSEQLNACLLYTSDAADE